MIREGLFVRQWSGTIEQYFAVKYELTELGRTHFDTGEFQALGFYADVDTISRRYLSFENISTNNELLGLLNEGIETHLGHWIPKSLIQNQDNKKKVEQFYRDLSQIFEQQIIKRKEEMERDLEMLSVKGFIVSDQSPISQIQEKLQQLEHDDLKVEQLRSRISVFIVPYNLTQTREIRGVFEEIRDAHFMTSKKNDVMRKVVVDAMLFKKPSLVNSD